MNAHNMFVDVSVRAVINCSLPLLHGLYIFNTICYTVYCLCCVASLYFTARTLIDLNACFIFLWTYTFVNVMLYACTHNGLSMRKC